MSSIGTFRPKCRNISILFDLDDAFRENAWKSRKANVVKCLTVTVW